MNEKLIHDFSKKPGMAGSLLFSLRHEIAQSHRGAFRHNLQRLGWLLGNAMAEVWPMIEIEVKTGLGVAKCNVIKEQPVLATVMRAGLPMHAGVLEVWDQADCAFVSAYRKHNDQGGFDIEIEYIGAPSCKDRILVLVDPMLATGNSSVAAIDLLKQAGYYSSKMLTASLDNIDFIKAHFPENTHLWIAAIDNDLNEKGYIIPGLGDAGDLSYGTKSRS